MKRSISGSLVRGTTPSCEHKLGASRLDRTIWLTIAAVALVVVAATMFGHFTIADAFYAPVATRFATYDVALPVAARAYAKRILALAPMREWAKAAKTEAATA
jgi:hypothetical protein